MPNLNPDAGKCWLHKIWRSTWSRKNCGGDFIRNASSASERGKTDKDYAHRDDKCTYSTVYGSTPLWALPIQATEQSVVVQVEQNVNQLSLEPIVYHGSMVNSPLAWPFARSTRTIKSRGPRL